MSPGKCGKLKKNLKRIALAECDRISDDGLRAFAHHPTLKTFDSYNISWEDVVSVASTCMRLKCIGISTRMRSPGANTNFWISDDGMFHLKQLAELGDLDLSKCGVNVTDTDILSVSEISNIRKLDLSWLINVTDTSLFNIASKCSKLEVIKISGCEAITDKGLRAFAHHPTLKTFDSYNISWEDVVSVASTCMRLKCIGISTRMRSKLVNDRYNLLLHRQCN
uniref:F-box/LRR-repeat protein 15-like leucin rich repeat domain-containing protein n=1 Tax=Tanacetum cinerariifolium TaxID=118510 RepID=A0A699K9G4_TANCI|nr:hypothetical protein [Tanacetum cinerariifolium]